MMQILIAALLAALPNALIFVLSKLVSEKFLQMVIERVIVFALKKAVLITSNTVDDEIVVEIEKRFKEVAT